MPRIAQPFLDLLTPTSAGGPSITAGELSAALMRTTVEEARTFAAQAIDTLADGALVQRLSRKVGPAAIPAALNSLGDHAASAAWLAGDLTPGAHSAEARAATVLMQRAMVKIGAHHAGASALPALLQLPWGADGDAGALTLAAIDAAMELSGVAVRAATASDLGQDVAGGYSDSAPGTWTGGISHCQAWETLYQRARDAGGDVTISAEDMMHRLQAIGGMARRKMHNIATYSAATGQYSTYRDASTSGADSIWEHVVEQLGGDATRAAALEAQLQALEPEMNQLLAGTHPTLDLRQVKPDDDTVARQVYGLAGDLAGETGATAAQAAYAEAWRDRSLAARFYARVLEKFCAAPNILALMQTAATELAAAGATTCGAAELQGAAFSRAQMLAHIAELTQLSAGGGLSETAASYVALLEKMIGRLEGIPNTWV